MGEFMKYVVDHIIDDKIILENIDTKKVIEISKKDISFKVIEGNVLIKKNSSYYLDYDDEIRRREKIQMKLDNLKGEFNEES